MSEYIQMTPFILPLLLSGVLLCGIWFHDVAYRHRVQGVSGRKAVKPIIIIGSNEAEHEGEAISSLQIARQ